MNCEKCGKSIPQNIDYCPACSLAENPNYIKYQEERNNDDNHQINNSEVKSSSNVVSPIEETIEAKPEQEKITEIIVKCQCGQKLEAGWKSCPQCNIPINVEIANGSINSSTTEKNGNSSIYVTVFLISVALGYFINGIFFLVALITIITGKIKCPNSRAILVLFWLSLFFIALYVILIIWVIIACGNALPSCLGEMQRCG